MLQVRFHGRGGQGAVTAAELLSVAAFDEGLVAQAIPSFGSERMGAPVVAFCRIADHPIRTREPVTVPDVVVVADATLVHHVALLEGLAAGGSVLVNTSSPPGLLRARLTAPPGVRMAAVPATELARTHVGRPVPNAALLGGFCALTGVVSVRAVAAALIERFGPDVGAANAAAAQAGYELVVAAESAASAAATA
jgi:pyruvate ferredoxin oxidoreductase gamma subunit